ncbi:MAG: hypothetical protein ACR2HE_09605 [Casimicrobiaceae bacterium]
MGIFGLVLGLLLIWAMGMALVIALSRRTPLLSTSGGLAWTVGSGAFAGAFLATIWMRALSLAGISFGIVAIFVPLLLLGAALAWLGLRRELPGLPGVLRDAADILRGRHLRGLPRVLWLALLAWLVLRFSLLFAEVAWKPLYPWDSWTQWGTKARVWYELGRLVPFEAADVWLAANGASYFDAAPHYPGTVPLLQVFANVALGRWDDALMNVIFWMLAVALSCAVFGALRAMDFGPSGALVGAWLVASLPLANVHVALAGYADLPLAAFFTVSVLAGLRWLDDRDTGDAVLAVLLLAACPLIKVPGRIWVLTLVPALLVAFFPRHGRKLVAAGFAVVLFALLVLAQTNPVILNYRLHLDFAPEWGALADSYFLLGNWHLLWYGALAALLLGWRQLMSPRLAPFTMVIAAGGVFLFVVFAFTNARAWVADQTTVNRATLHLAPLVTVWMLAVFRAWVQDRRALEAEEDDPTAVRAA